MKITNHDLHIMLTEIKGDVKSIIEKTESLAEWQKEHEEKDDKRFNSLNHYAASVSIVSSAIGAGGMYVWNKLMGRT